MFRGSSTLTLDAKGRMAIPGRYRTALGERCGGRLVVTVNPYGAQCLWAYPMDAWVVAERKVDELPTFVAEHQQIKRFFIGHAREVEMDKSGRVLLPAALTEFARIDKEICLAGQVHKFEIWDAALWKKSFDSYQSETADFSNMSADMEQLSL